MPLATKRQRTVGNSNSQKRSSIGSGEERQYTLQDVIDETVCDEEEDVFMKTPEPHESPELLALANTKTVLSSSDVIQASEHIYDNNNLHSMRSPVDINRLKMWIDDRLSILESITVTTAEDELLPFPSGFISLNIPCSKKIICSGLSDHQISILKETLQRLNDGIGKDIYELRSTFTETVSDNELKEYLLVMPEEGAVPLLHSDKLYLAIALGIPIVSFKWIRLCHSNRKYSIWPDDGLRNIKPDYWIRLGHHRKSYLMSHWRERSKVFRGTLVMFVESTYNGREDEKLLIRLIKLSGGFAFRVSTAMKDESYIHVGSETESYLKSLGEPESLSSQISIMLIVLPKDSSKMTLRKFFARYLFELEQIRLRGNLSLLAINRKSITACLYNDDHALNLLNDKELTSRVEFINAKAYTGMLMHQLLMLASCE